MRMGKKPFIEDKRPRSHLFKYLWIGCDNNKARCFYVCENDELLNENCEMQKEFKELQINILKLDLFRNLMDFDPSQVRPRLHIKRQQFRRSGNIKFAWCSLTDFTTWLPIKGNFFLYMHPRETSPHMGHLKFFVYWIRKIENCTSKVKVFHYIHYNRVLKPVSAPSKVNWILRAVSELNIFGQ